MNYRRTFTQFGWATLALAILISGCGNSMNSAAATVGDSTITNKQYYSYLEQKGTMLVSIQGQTVNAQLAGSPGFQALRDLIFNDIILKIAKDEGVLPSQSDVEKELNFRQETDKNLMSNAIANGYTPEMLEDQIKVDLAKFNIVTKGVTVTNDEVDQFIKDHPDQFMNPPAIDSSMVVVPTADKQAQVDAAIKKGAAFDTVAAQFTTQINAAQSKYRYSVTDPTKMPAQVAALLNATAVNHASSWIKSKDGFVKFYVNSKTPSSPMAITAHVKELVRRALLQQKGINAQDFNKMVTDQLIKMKDDIKVEDPAVKGQWQQFTSLLTASSAANQSSPAPAGSSAAPAGGTSGPAAPTTAN